MKEELIKNYEAIFEPALIDDIFQVAVFKDFAEGDLLIDYGQRILKMPLLLEGALKILREDLDEGELLLYFIEKGDTCAMTLACCLGDTYSEIRAVAENDGKVAMIPVNKMEDWLSKYKSWRNFVFNSYNIRLKEMLASIDQLAFMNMNDRLMKYLEEKSKIYHSKDLKTTHLEIAHDLNTSRVVVSRLLKVFENEQKIKIHRASIELL